MTSFKEMKEFVRLIQRVNTKGIDPLISLSHNYTDLTLRNEHLEPEKPANENVKYDVFKYCNPPIFRK